jgi:hypothetical protein
MESNNSSLEKTNVLLATQLRKEKENFPNV